jgi:hypothetical protein
MLVKGCYTASNRARGKSIPHILDHEYGALNHLGDVTNVYVSEVALKDLGINSPDTTEALLMDSNVRKDYNPTAFLMYSEGKINQHSIGLKYEEIKLAINSTAEEDKSYKVVWDKHYNDIINKEAVDKNGYFWAVTKVDVRENSAVLFGANSLTPTLNIGKVEPTTSTKAEHVKSTIPKTSGENKAMTLEDALIEIDKLKSENIGLKASASVHSTSLETKVTEAVKAERDRVLSIQKTAIDTLGIKSDLTDLISKGLPIADTIGILELVKAEAQKQNPSPLEDNGISNGVTGGSNVMKQAFQKLETQQAAPRFIGVR